MSQQPPYQNGPGQPFVQPNVQQHVPPQWQGQPPYGWHPQQAAPARRRHRIFPWVFLAVQALFIIWIIAGARSAASTQTNCQYLTQQECRNAVNAGAAIGVGIIIFLWALVDVILGVGYLVLRRR